MWKANQTISIAFPLIIAAAMLAAATAQSPGPAPDLSGAPSPAVDCFPYLLNLSDCLTYVQGGSNLTKPEPGCCPELSNLVDTQPVCLCQLLGNSGQLGTSVDINKALKLPSLCNVTTPPVSLCAAIGYPVSAPTPSEAPSTGEAEAAAPPSPAGNAGSATTLSFNYHFLIGSLPPLFFSFFF